MVAGTIFAVASGSGRSAITVVRLSGEAAGGVVATLCGRLPPPRRASLCALKDAEGGLLDRSLVLWMPGPGSYTGEDCAELSLHGGQAVLQAVSDALRALGARPAEPGEFTRRAFLAGRMDLLEAEAIADLVAAETDAQRRQALRQLQGGPGAMLKGWAGRMRQALAFQEALIDFPEEGIPEDVEQALRSDLETLHEEMSAQAALVPRVARLREGLVFAITGPPNAGKSSLVNALAGRDVAIVAATPGTTRDALEVAVVLAGMKVTLIDTAGLRDTTDPVEAEGVRRARARAASAELVITLFAAGEASAEAPGGALLVANKTDLAPAPYGVIGVSALTGDGLGVLEECLADHARRLAHAGAGPVLSRARHETALREAASAISHALGCVLPELCAEELRLAMAALGRITGAVDSEAILDTIFSSFCIGK